MKDMKDMNLVRHAPFISNCYACGRVSQNAGIVAFEIIREYFTYESLIIGAIHRFPHAPKSKVTEL